MVFDKDGRDQGQSRNSGSFGPQRDSAPIEKRQTDLDLSRRNLAGTHDMAEFRSGAGVYAMKAKVPIIPLMFHHQSKPFHRNYLIVGDKIDLSDFYGKNMHEVKEEVAALLHEKMEELHLELDRKVAEMTAKKK